MPRNPINEGLEMRMIGQLNKVNKKFRDGQSFTTTPWIVPTFLNSWVNFGGSDAIAGYYIDPGAIVRLKGKVKTGTINTAIFTLPVGYRPLENMYFAITSNDAFAVLKIDTAGNVICTNGNTTYVSLNGVSFRIS